LLSIRDVSVDFVSAKGRVRAIDRVTLDVARGEILGLAGESGSGKSTLAQALLRILPPPAVITGGSALFEGRDLFAMSERDLCNVRWKRLAIVLQSSLDALNPVLPIGEQLVDTLRAHGSARGQESRRAAELLDAVGIASSRLRSYPHELSGGMRQRVAIALAIALDPALVILDEPTTALDVLVERDVLAMLLGLRDRMGFSVVFITHDLARMSQVSDRIAVLYGARLVEVARTAELLRAPRHPYTQALLRTIPSVEPRDGGLVTIRGTPPSLVTPPLGCRFHPRCDKAIEACRAEQPALLRLGPDHIAACHLEREPARIEPDGQAALTS
jgi:peptide/nickel transport system ATP-binding protein